MGGNEEALPGGVRAGSSDTERGSCHCGVDTREERDYGKSKPRWERVGARPTIMATGSRILYPSPQAPLQEWVALCKVTQGRHGGSRRRTSATLWPLRDATAGGLEHLCNLGR